MTTKAEHQRLYRQRHPDRHREQQRAYRARVRAKKPQEIR